jgi:hypothetical protein
MIQKGNRCLRTGFFIILVCFVSTFNRINEQLNLLLQKASGALDVGNVTALPTFSLLFNS